MVYHRSLVLTSVLAIPSPVRFVEAAAVPSKPFEHVSVDHKVVEMAFLQELKSGVKRAILKTSVANTAEHGYLQARAAKRCLIKLTGEVAPQ